jgi:hypothetical protein
MPSLGLSEMEKGAQGAGGGSKISETEIKKRCERSSCCSYMLKGRRLLNTSFITSSAEAGLGGGGGGLDGNGAGVDQASVRFPHVPAMYRVTRN